MPTLRAKLSLFSDRQLLGYLQGLAFAALEDLREHAERGTPLPGIYQSGVRYQREPPGKEDWLLPSQALKLKVADCEDLAAWRVGQAWLEGEDRARIFLKRVNPRLRHIQVLRADGQIEDPSRILGMGRP